MFPMALPRQPDRADESASAASQAGAGGAGLPPGRQSAAREEVAPQAGQNPGGRDAKAAAAETAREREKLQQPQQQQPLSDDEIVRRIRGGDVSAFDVVVARHGDDLYGVAYSMVGNAADAEDVVQQALLGAYRRITSFEGRSTLKTWLISIVMNQASKALRSRRVRRALSLDAADEEGGPSAAAAGALAEAASTPPATAAVDTQIDLVAMLATLSPDHRDVIVLRELQRMTYDEIAAALKIPRGTVESRIFRARRELRERFQEYAK
jgi:RNA polymerase sigma-70 factor (ECF subfamily)